MENLYEHRGFRYHIHNSWDIDIIREGAKGLDQYGQKLNALVMDIGAHHGSFAFQAIRQGANIVYAYEPDMTNFQTLVRNILENNLWGRVVPIGCGVGARAGRVPLHITGNNSGQRSTILQKSTLEESSYHYIYLVDFYQECIGTAINYLKMDIEGLEWEIMDIHKLQSGQEVLKQVFKKVKVLEIETHEVPNRDFTRDCRDLYKFLLEIGFKPLGQGTDYGARVYIK